MRRKFATNLVFILTANLLVKPFWIFGVDRVVQNNVGPETYGTYFAVFNYSYLLSIILDFGINNFNNRAVSRNKNRVADYVFNLLLLKTALSFIYMALTFVSALITGFQGQELQMLLFLGINQILLSLILYFRSNIAALQLFKTDSIISTLDKLLSILFCVILIYLPAFKNGFNIMWFIYAQTAALFITAVIAFAVIAKKSFIKINVWKPRYIRMILLKSAPFALLALLMGIYYRVDAVMIKQMLPNGRQEAGIYAASFRLLDAVNQFGYLFATLLLPMFAHMIRRNEHLGQLVKFSSELMYAAAVTLGFTCYAFRNEMMSLMYHNSNNYWALIFGWLMINFIPMSSIYIFGTLLTAKGSLRALNTIAVGGVLVNVGLNLFLIPKYGALGATMATLITQVFAAAAHIWVAERQFSFGYGFKDVLKLSAFTILSIVIAISIKTFGIDWRFATVLSLALSGVLALVLGLVPIADILKLLRNKATS